MSFVDEEKNYFAPFKKHECILNNKSELFENKVESLIEVWKSVGELNLSQFDIRHVIQIMDWAKLHALNIVLTAEWNGFKATHQTRLLQEIEKAQNELLKLNSGFATRCKKLADVVKNPWEDVVLMKLMKTKNAEIGPEEIEFFCVETAYVVSVRLKKLCESHCEDLALNLVTAFMNCNKLSKTQNFSLNATETQMWFIFDIYIALLYKFQEKQQMVFLLKELTFEEGLQLVKRFAKKRVKISKIWKSCQRIAVLATQMYISQAVVKYTEELKGVLESYIELYVSLCNTDSLLQDFSTSIRRISNLADAAGLYIFCDVIQKTAGTKLKTFVIEMFIRALTTDMNDLERQKDANEKEKVAAITSRLAAAFCNLADFLDEHVKVARECILTAFSLEPTKERLTIIETLARRSGFQVLDTGQEWKCKLHPPVLASDEIAWMCPECGDWMCKPQLNIPLKINMALNEALQNSVLGISEALCDDLVVCLSNPRYQILSWFLPWDDLHRLCIMYLQDPETTKNVVTELKFVDIDYSIFKGIKREPLDELAGIERGYEQYLDQDFVSDEETSSVSEDSMSQDSRPYSLGSDGAGEGPYLPMLPPQPKSDPNTLKSLRMFRPNLKRPKTSESTDDLPRKLHKVESMTNTNHPHTVTSNFKGPPKNDNSGSLSSFLNGISSTSPHTSAINSQSSHSKNVKVATLPPLGGQVANLLKPIQVRLQPLEKLCQRKEKSPSPKTRNHTTGQALKPYNQAKGTISETTRKDLMQKILSKSLLNGAKENNKVTNHIPELLGREHLTEIPSTMDKTTQNPEALSNVRTAQTSVLTIASHHDQNQHRQPMKACSVVIKEMTAQMNELQKLKLRAQTKEKLNPKKLINCLAATTKPQIQDSETTLTSEMSQSQTLNPQKTIDCLPTKNAQIEETISSRMSQLNRSNKVTHHIISTEETPQTTQIAIPSIPGHQYHQDEHHGHSTKARGVRTENPTHLNRSKNYYPLSNTHTKLEKPTTQISQPQKLTLQTQTLAVNEKSNPKRLINCLPATTQPQIQLTEATSPTSQMSQSQTPNLQRMIDCFPATKNVQNLETVSTRLSQVNRSQKILTVEEETPRTTQMSILSIPRYHNHQDDQHVHPKKAVVKTEDSQLLHRSNNSLANSDTTLETQTAQMSQLETLNPQIQTVVVKENSHLKELINCLPVTTKSQNQDMEATSTCQISQSQTLNHQRTIGCLPVTTKPQVQDTEATSTSQMSQLQALNLQRTIDCHPTTKNAQVKEIIPPRISQANQPQKITTPLISTEEDQMSIPSIPRYQCHGHPEVTYSLRGIQPSHLNLSKNYYHLWDSKLDTPTDQISQSQKLNHQVQTLIVKENLNPQSVINCLPSTAKPQIQEKEATSASHMSQSQTVNLRKTKDCLPVTTKPQIQDIEATPTYQMSQPQALNLQRTIDCLSATTKPQVKDIEEISMSQALNHQRTINCLLATKNLQIEETVSPRISQANQPQKIMTPLISTEEETTQMSIPSTPRYQCHGHPEVTYSLRGIQPSHLNKSKNYYHLWDSKLGTPTDQISQSQKLNLQVQILVTKETLNSKVINCLPATAKPQIQDIEATSTSQSQTLNIQRTIDCLPVTNNAQIKETVSLRTTQVDQSENVNLHMTAMEGETSQATQRYHEQHGQLRKACSVATAENSQLHRLNNFLPESDTLEPHPKISNLQNLDKMRCVSVPPKLDKAQKLLLPQDKVQTPPAAALGPQLVKHNQELTSPNADRTLVVPLNPILVDTLVSSYTKNNSEPSKESQPQVPENEMNKIGSPQTNEIQAQAVCKNEVNLKSDKGCNLNSINRKCNTGQMGSNVQVEVTESSNIDYIIDSNRNFVKNEKSESSETVGQHQRIFRNCLGIIDDGIFSDLTDCEHKSEDLYFKNNNDYSSFVIKDVNVFENSPNDEIPKNFNLTENIRTYTKKCTKKIPVAKDCVKKSTGDEKFDVCKNVYSSTSVNKPHSDVQNSQTHKELIVVLHRLPSNNLSARMGASDIDRNSSIKQKCDRGKTPPKNVRKRKSMDKSENIVEKEAPNRVQNHKLSPLQDINPRVTPKENSKLCCDDLNKLKDTFQESLTPRVLLERIHIDNKSYARSVLANVPGLNDYQMIRPVNVNHIVNVVQVSGGRTTQNVPLQNSQTSTQVSPHIQRIGQPRVTDQKPEHSNSLISATTVTTTTTTAKTTTSQPSTLINILSQQIIRPVTTPTNAVRRQTPFINILSQQIIRPSQTQKITPNASAPITDNNQVKPPGTPEQTISTQANNVAKNTLASIKANQATTGQGGTILQLICKSSLPKFQQAFGKSVYQNNTETSNTTTSTIETTNIAADAKKNITKTVPVNVQPIQGSVIYSRQMPVAQTISLIPPGGTTRQVFRIATSNSDQISLVKDSHIHSKMSALLAALQGRPKNSEGDQVNSEEKITLTRPTLVQNARIVKPVQLQLPPNVVRTTPQANLSSTTLEQLREFDMVYKQIKERSSSTTPAETSNSPPENQEVTQQRISVTYVNQLQKYTQLSPVVVVSSYSNLQPAASPALSVTSQGSSSPCVTPAPTPTLPKIATKTSKGKTLKNAPNNATTKSSPVPKPQQKPQEDEHTTQRIFDILAEYAEQLRNSPDLNNKPAPRRRSNPPTNPSQNSKRKKSSSGSKKSGQSSNTIEIDADDITVGSEDSSGGGIVQLSVTDDEQSQAATLNTPESTENSSPSSSRQVILTESGTCGNQSRNLIIADSSVGEALKIPNTAVIVPGNYIVPVSMVKGGQQIAVVSGGSKILATVPARSGQNMLLFQSFTNQNRKGAISAVKYSAIQPLSGISSQSLAGVSAQPPVILPSNSVATAIGFGQPLTLKKLNDDRDNNELLLTISQPPKDEIKNTEMPQPDSSTSISSDSNDIKMEDGAIQSDNSNEKIFQTFQKSVITNSVATSVIATTSTSCIKDDEENQNQNIITMNLSANNKVEPKSSERMQSVLVTACSSNGPMLSHTTPRYRKPSDTGRTNNNDLPKEEYLHNGEKTNNTEQKSFRGNVTYYTNKTKKNCADTQKMDSEMQKQAAIERELRLQKSLSEECEDLGVDEPSTSDLFPEADLLFDSNHSPSFDQSSQDIIKRAPHSSEIKEEIKAAMNNLFSDDDNSSSLRTDLFEYVEYQTVETALDYQARQLMNGNTTSNESGSSGCEDNTLLAKCATMSEVTLNSPISPEMYTESSLNKYKFKYSNRKKGERIKQGDFGGEIVSSSEDTIGSTELGKVNCEEDNFKVVHLAITKTDIVKEEEKCELHCEDDLDSPSGRGARRSVRKLCSCCNGSQDGNISRKRPHTSRPHTPAAPHKKAFLNKKR